MRKWKTTKSSDWLYNATKAAELYADRRAKGWDDGKMHTIHAIRHEALVGFILGIDYVLYHRPLPRGLRREPLENEWEAMFIKNLP